jgi:uncharacterized membrane protein YhaH (DUF805 family)
MTHSSGEFWRALFSARGRNRRARFWTVCGLQLLAILVAGLAGSLVFLTASLPLAIALGVFAFLLLVAAVCAQIANIIKRLHDLGSSGWWVLAMMAGNLVGVGVIALIAIGCIEGDPRPNRFGDPPGRPRATEPHLAEVFD